MWTFLRPSNNLDMGYNVKFTIIYVTNANLASVVDWVITTKDSQVLMPEFVSVTLYSKRDLEDLRWGDYPGLLSGWALKCNLCPGKKEAEGNLTTEKKAVRHWSQRPCCWPPGWRKRPQGMQPCSSFWTSDLQSCVRIIVCYFKPWVRGNLLQQT